MFAGRIARLCAIGMLFTAGCGVSPAGGDATSLKEAWNAANDPRRLASDFVVKLADLPLAGEATEKPWTDYYWPHFRAGVANRWEDPASPDNFTYPLAARDAVAAMTPQQLQQLSPAEKYDLYIGDFSYPLVNYERRRTKPTADTWWGLCHGWAPASLHFKEPRPVTVTGAAGTRIPFGTSDVQALLTLFQQYNRASGSAKLLGARCNVDLTTAPDLARNPECRDTNAGSFHIVIANQLGLRQQGVVADLDRGLEVWNHPLFRFATTIVGDNEPLYPTAARDAVRIVKVSTTINYAAGSRPHWEPMPYAPDAAYVAAKTLAYTLELNAAGAIVGGEWLQEDRPDFLWSQVAPPFSGFFAKLGPLYEAATAR